MDYVLIAAVGTTQHRNADSDDSNQGMNGEAEDVVEGGIHEERAETAHRALDQILLTPPASHVGIGTKRDHVVTAIGAGLNMMKP